MAKPIRGGTAFGGRPSYGGGGSSGSGTTSDPYRPSSKKKSGGGGGGSSPTPQKSVIIVDKSGKPVNDLLTEKQVQDIASDARSGERLTSERLADELKQTARERAGINVVYSAGGRLIAVSPALATLIERQLREERSQASAEQASNQAAQERAAQQRSASRVVNATLPFANPNLTGVASDTVIRPLMRTRQNQLAQERFAQGDVPLTSPPATVMSREEFRQRQLMNKARELRESREARGSPFTGRQEAANAPLLQAQADLLLERAGAARASGRSGTAALNLVAGGLADVYADVVSVAASPLESTRRGVVALGGFGVRLVANPVQTTKDVFTGITQEVFTNPVGFVTEAVLIDKGVRATIRGGQLTRFVGKNQVRASEVIDPQSILGVSDDLLQEVRYPVSQSAQRTTKATQAAGSDEIVKNINPQKDVLLKSDFLRETGFSRSVWDFEKGRGAQAFQAAPVPLPTKGGRVKVLTQLEKVEMGLDLSETGGLYASDLTSTAFLGLGGESTTVTLLPSVGGRASIQRIQTSAARIPTAQATTFEQGNIFLDEVAAGFSDEATAFISPAREFRLKTEKEVIIGGGSVLERTKQYNVFQRALGRDFEDYTLVPKDIPTNNLQSNVQFLDPFTGVPRTTPQGTNFVGLPTPQLTPVPIRDFTNLGAIDDAARVGTEASFSGSRSRAPEGTPRSSVVSPGRISQTIYDPFEDFEPSVSDSPLESTGGRVASPSRSRPTSSSSLPSPSYDNRSFERVYEDLSEPSSSQRSSSPRSSKSGRSRSSYDPYRGLSSGGSFEDPFSSLEGGGSSGGGGSGSPRGSGSGGGSSGGGGSGSGTGTGLLNIDLPGAEKKTTKSKKKKDDAYAEYTSSLTAAFLGIEQKGTKSPTGVTGIEIRGL